MDERVDLIVESPKPLWMGPLLHHQLPPADLILNFCAEDLIPPSFKVVMLHFPLYDHPSQEALPERKRLERFLAGAHQLVQNEASYWHCYAGLNRSGLALAAYLHLHHQMHISAAIALLRERRSQWVLCNRTFERTLRRWYGDDNEQHFKPASCDDYLEHRSGED